MTDAIEVIDSTFEEDPDYDAQILDALDKALEIQGTIVNDLQFAINIAIQYQRQYTMLCAPDPQEKNLKYLVEKYNMARKEHERQIENQKTVMAGRPKELNEHNG